MPWNPHLPDNWKPVKGTVYGSHDDFVVSPGQREPVRRFLEKYHPANRDKGAKREKSR